MLRTKLSRLVMVLLAMSLTVFILAAQDQTIPLQNWPAPLYWQPAAPAESLKAAATGPRLAAVYTAPLVFVGMTPCRILDTRDPVGTFGGPSITGGTSRSFPVLSSACAVPSNAAAYSFNVTVVPIGFLWYLTIWPTGQPQPWVSTMNDSFGQILANAAIVPAGDGGSVSIYVSQTANVLVDINGYYMPPSALALGAGTTGAPSLTFSNDANSGVYSPAAGTVAITSGGTNRLTVNSAGASVAGDLDLSGNITRGGQSLLRVNTFSVAAGLGAGFPTGSNNGTALGGGALAGVTSGSWNTAVGYLAAGAAGASNLWSTTAVGARALRNSTYGWNTAVGVESLFSVTTGDSNAALGYQALYSATGNNNIGIGAMGGSGLGAGSNNIAIGNPGQAADSGTIRIGSGSNNRAFIAGIRSVVPAGSSLNYMYIDENGQLGSAVSSRRFKQDISELGDITETVMALHPVRFRYKTHGPNGREQYGLVAEEVAEVAPELTGRDKNGEIDSVAYDKVNIMLLSEVQKQRRLIQSQEEIIRKLENRLAAIEGRLE